MMSGIAALTAKRFRCLSSVSHRTEESTQRPVPNVANKIGNIDGRDVEEPMFMLPMFPGADMSAERQAEAAGPDRPSCWDIGNIDGRNDEISTFMLPLTLSERDRQDV